jgi:radical SAM-linked protein
MSHRDTMRMFERMLVRSGLPVKYSEGFNPRVRLSVPLPRPVGVAADDELLVFAAAEEFDTEPAGQRLRAESPAGLCVAGLGLHDSAVGPQPVRAHYELTPSSGWPKREEEASGRSWDEGSLGEAVDRFMLSSSWRIERILTGGRGSKTRRLDLRPFVEHVELGGGRLMFVLPVRQTGSAKPGEVLEALGLTSSCWLHRLRRTRVEWEPPLRVQSIDRSVSERND